MERNARERDDTEESTEADGTTVRLREELAALRESGCAMLVVGEVPTEVSRRACADLSGGAGRELVSVRTGGGCACETGDDTHAVQWADKARGAAAADGAMQYATGVVADRVTTAETLAELGEATVRVVDRVATDTGPGELRVCVDSVGPLVEATSERAVFKYLHQLTAAVRAGGGLGHVHLPMARDSELVSVFRSLFDVTVELRLFGGEPRQRWYLHEAGVVSDWLPLGVSGE